VHGKSSTRKGKKGQWCRPKQATNPKSNPLFRTSNLKPIRKPAKQETPREDGKKEVKVPDSSESFNRNSSFANRKEALGQSARSKSKSGSQNESRADSVNSMKKSARHNSPELSQRNMEDDGIKEFVREESMPSSKNIVVNLIR
jgi:hypothetical protein